MQSEERLPTKIVCIYAKRDERFYRALQEYLSLWQRKGYIQWIEYIGGTKAEESIQTHLRQANLILLLMSPSFFAHNLCYKAMEVALQEQARRQVPVVPVLVRACDWKESACGDSKALPDNEQPIAKWHSPEQAYENIREGLVHFVPIFRAQSVIPPPNRPRIFQARDLPKGYVLRPKVFHNIKSKLLSGHPDQTAAIATALRGAGGFGKTTMALALCHDAQIQMAFPDGILWIELGEHPPKLLDLLNALLASLEPSSPTAITEEEARDRWHAALSERRYLLVIDDVWQAATLTPLLEGGSQCMRLVTTRDDRVLPEEATLLFVDAMEPEEAIAVLCRGLPEKIQQGVYQPTLLALVRRLGCWPLLLSLAHGLLRDQIRYGRTISQALDVVEHAYQRRGVTAFHLEMANERHQTVERCLEVSLRHLESFTLAHYQAVTRYQELAIFPEDTEIPLAILHTFWQRQGNLETWEVDELCVRLHQLSLLLSCDLGKGVVRLHDVMRSYLIQHAGSNLLTLHTRFLDALKPTVGQKRWRDLPANEHYLWQHLVLHLCAASQSEALQATLTDLLYLARKVLYVGVSVLEADLLRACTFEQTRATTSANSLFEFLHRTMIRISHLLRHVSTLAEASGILLSYLGWQPPFVKQGSVFWSELPRPFLTAWHPLSSGSSSALLRTLRGHLSWINGCAVSPDSRFIVSASWDHTLKVWNAITGTERLTLVGHTSEVRGCAVSPDGSYIVSASHDKTLKVWDAVTGAERLTLVGLTSEVRGCAVSPDGSYIVSASDDHTLKVWDAVTGAERLTLTGHTNTVRGCAVSSDGSYIVSASNDHTLKVWDAVTGAERLTLIGHTNTVRGCAVSPDGSYIVSASDDHTLKVWDAVTGAERLTLMGHTDEVNGCAVSPDGSYIVSASDDHTLKVWDTARDAEPPPSAGHTNTVRGCAVSPDGSYIVSASNDQTLKVWDAITGAERLTLTGHTGAVRGCAVSPDGSYIVSASQDHTLKAWDAVTGTERLTLVGHTNWVIGCTVSSNGRFIVSTSYDHTLKVWDAVTGAERLTLVGHTNTVRGCAVSPDGSYIVSSSNDHTLKVWDAVTGAERLTLVGHTNTVRGCAVSPDGSYIVSASDDHTLKVWDAVTGAEHLTLVGHTDWVTGCTVSPDGGYIVSASYDHTLKVWDSQTGQCVLTFPVDGALSDCAFHPDGEHLVTCGAQGVFFLRLVV